VTEPLAIGIAGCGRVAERGYLPAIAGSPHLRLAGVADPIVSRRDLLAPALPGFDTVDELLSSVRVDVLVVATPPGLHEPVAVAAAAAGVRSIVEKPPAGDAVGAAALAALEPPPWIGFNRRFEPEIERLREDIAAAHGRTIEVTLSIDARRWRAFESRPGPLLDLGPHAVDVICWTTGRLPRRVRCEHDRRYLSFSLELDGVVARVRLSHQAGWRERVRLGNVTYLRRGGTVDRARRAVSRRPGPLVPSLRAQLEAAARFLQGEGRVDARLGSAAEGVVVMATLDAMARAIREPDVWLPVEETPVPCSR
jgi:predicted dehydrogenase